MRLQTRWTLLLLPMLIIGCSDDSTKTTAGADTTPDGSSDTSADTGGSGADTDVDSDGSAAACPEREPQEGDAANPDCDPLNDGHCAMPWPSNLYLADDATTATGKRLTFGATTLPKNFQNIHIDPAPYARRDGYSVGTPLLVHFANLDTTGMADERDLSPSLADDAKLLWFKVSEDGSLSRVPYFVELDSQDPDPAKKTLFVRPGVILEEATRYIVAFRNLSDTSGQAIEAAAAFAALRDGRTDCDDRIAERAAHFDEAVFGPLEAAGIDRASLTLAWDFNTMSGENMHGDILRMRDEVLAAIDADPSASALTVTQVTAYSEAENPYIAFDMQGTFQIPNYTEEKTFYQGTDGVWGTFSAAMRTTGSSPPAPPKCRSGSASPARRSVRPTPPSPTGSCSSVMASSARARRSLDRPSTRSPSTTTSSTSPPAGLAWQRMTTVAPTSWSSTSTALSGSPTGSSRGS